MYEVLDKYIIKFEIPLICWWQNADIDQKVEERKGQDNFYITLRLVNRFTRQIFQVICYFFNIPIPPLHF
jgi:hypothetical protein